MNEFKFSAMRQFGSEQVSYTSTVHHEATTLPEEEITKQVEAIHDFIEKSFEKCEERSISEKDILVKYSDKRREGVAKMDAALKEEMKAKQLAQQTLKDAERLSRKMDSKK